MRFLEIRTGGENAARAYRPVSAACAADPLWRQRADETGLSRLRLPIAL